MAASVAEARLLACGHHLLMLSAVLSVGKAPPMVFHQLQTVFVVLSVGKARLLVF